MNLGFRVVWSANGQAPVGWDFEMRERLGAEFLNGSLDGEGRLFNGTREVLIYRFTANFSDFDARAPQGNLSFPGRPKLAIALNLSGNVSDLLLSVLDI